MFYDTLKNDHGLPYNPFKACVVPRPIGWVSTLSHDGVPNLAPFSIFNQIAFDPPFVFFAGNSHASTGKRKDSVVNAEETGEFVVNMATYDLREAVRLSSTAFDEGVDEFEVCGLTKLPSNYVKPFRVAESPVQMECRYHQTLTLPSNRRDNVHRMVVGMVVGIHIDDRVIDSEGKVDILKIRPLSRVGYLDYTSVTDIFPMAPLSDSAALAGEAVAATERR